MRRVDRHTCPVFLPLKKQQAVYLFQLRWSHLPIALVVSIVVALAVFVLRDNKTAHLLHSRNIVHNHSSDWSVVASDGLGWQAMFLTRVLGKASPDERSRRNEPAESIPSLFRRLPWDNPKLLCASRYEYGWPLPCLYVEYQSIFSSSTIPSQVITQVVGGLEIPHRSAGVANEPGHIPVGVLWFSLLADSIAYMSVLAIAHGLWVAARRRIRVNRNCCAACGYPLWGSPDGEACSECGYARVATNK